MKRNQKMSDYDSAQTYQEFQSKLKLQQSDLDKDDIMKIMEHKSEYVQDLDNLPRQKHNWVRRGVKVSCEGANHPHHSHFLIRK